jgi:hypothetical protein
MGKENPVFFEDGIYRFVILHHTGTPLGGRGDHWDWMFDWPSERFLGGIARPERARAEAIADGSGRLVTFSSTQSPTDWDSGSEFEVLPLHRRRYLDYEGPISGNRGHVQRVASGRLRWLRMATYELAWKVESVDFLVQPSRDWAGTSYCMEREGRSVGCEGITLGDPPLCQELPGWMATDVPEALALPGAEDRRWILRRLSG